MRTFLSPLGEHFLCCFAVLVVLCSSGHYVVGQYSPPGDFIFPDLNELAIGDPCKIQASAATPYVRNGICRRVRECPTFVPRIIREPFDVRRDVCYFEIHDPVVCCVLSSSFLDEDFDNLIQ